MLQNSKLTSAAHINAPQELSRQAISDTLIGLTDAALTSTSFSLHVAATSGESRYQCAALAAPLPTWLLFRQCFFFSLDVSIVLMNLQIGR